MDTPGAPGQDREELAKQLLQMKKKYARIERKLQKSVKQKKVKDHVKRKLAELQHTDNSASPADTSRDEFKDIEKEQPTDRIINWYVVPELNFPLFYIIFIASHFLGSFPIGPLNLDDSVTTENVANQEESTKLNRKCASSSRLKKRRSVSFVLDNERKTTDEDKVGDDLQSKEAPTSLLSNNDQIKPPEKNSSSGSSHVENIDELRPDTPKFQTHNELEGSSFDVCDIADSEDVIKDLPDDVTCVEETQDLSQLLAPKILFKPAKKLDTGYRKQGEEKFENPALPVKSRNKSKDISFQNESTSTKALLRGHNDTDPTSVDAPCITESSTPQLAEVLNLDTFSDPGPRTSRRGRRRTRRSREFTAADISMKDVIQNSQSSQEGNHTWIEGLIYPVEYYVRKTRSMSGKASPAIYSENLLASIERMDHMEQVSKSSQGKASARGRRGRAKGRASQHEGTYRKSQSQATISSEDASFKDSIDSNIPDGTATKLVNDDEVSDVEKVELAEIIHVDSAEQSASMSQVSAQNSVELITSGSREDSARESQQPESTGSSLSSNSSSNSTRSGRRILSLSRRKRGLGKKAAKQSVEKLVQLSIGTVVSTSQTDQSSMCLADHDASILPKLISKIKTKLLSQTVDFTLPDDEFAEMKLSNTVTLSAISGPDSSQTNDIQAKTLEVPCTNTKSTDKDDIDPAACSVDPTKAIPESSRFEENAADFVTPDVHISRMHVAKSKPYKDTIDDVQMKETSQPSRGKKPFTQQSQGIAVSLLLTDNSIQKETSKPSRRKKPLKPSTRQSQQVFKSQSQGIQEFLLPSDTSNSSNKVRENSKPSRRKKPVKPSSQQSQGVLESQFSQTQFVPDGTPAFPHMGSSPGSSPSEVVISGPTLIQSPTSPSEQSSPTKAMSGPSSALTAASHSEQCSMSTMSFSPQQVSPTSMSKFESGKSQDDPLQDGNNVHSVVGTSRSVDVKDEEMEMKSIEENCVEEKSVPPPLEEAFSPPDQEYSPPNNGIITPPMTSGNISHTSPFADVATATPYGKAEIPRCQSQCDPEERNNDGDAREEQMDGFQFAGCLKHDFPDFSTPILGMQSCDVIIDSEPASCLVIYSVDLVVLWIMRYQQDWQMQAAWTVTQDEEIACVKLLQCDENVLSLVTGGILHKCCARVLRYSIVTGDQHQLDLSLSLKPENIQFQDVCILSHDTVLIQGRQNFYGQEVHKINISEDFNKATSKLIHRSEDTSLSIQRVHGLEDIVVIADEQDILLWDCQSDCILQKFSIPVTSDVATKCVWATAQSSVVFAVLGFKPTKQSNQGKPIPPCFLLALNPATGKSAILHQYKIPGINEDSVVWFDNGIVVQDNLAVKTSDGELVMWDVHSAHPVTKTEPYSQNFLDINSARFTHDKPGRLTVYPSVSNGLKLMHSLIYMLLICILNENEHIFINLESE